MDITTNYIWSFIGIKHNNLYYKMPDYQIDQNYTLIRLDQGQKLSTFQPHSSYYCEKCKGSIHMPFA